MFKFYFDDEQKEFDKLRSANKITYEFYVNVDKKDRFLQLVSLLSSVEFMVDVDLNNIRITEYGDNAIFRIKASGERKDLDKWKDNLDCVIRFLNGEYNIYYPKKRSDSNAN